MSQPKLTTAEIEKLAELAKIQLTAGEKEKFATQLTAILEYVATVNSVETGAAVFKSQVDTKNVFKDDVPGVSLSQTDAVSQTKNKNGYILINRVINEKH
ncbi:MAG: Asp-tRNA(Asn)/Glu-tRNA(Gln) amidotransferase subunit GatC [bacterium]